MIPASHFDDLQIQKSPTLEARSSEKNFLNFILKNRRRKVGNPDRYHTLG
jgi:hypothetical protein